MRHHICQRFGHIMTGGVVAAVHLRTFFLVNVSTIILDQCTHMYSAGKETALFFKKGGWHQRCTIHVTFNTYNKQTLYQYQR